MQGQTDSAAGVPLGSMLGRYKIARQLGEGSMGIVYAAVDSELEREVALKLLRKAHPSAIDAFKREFRALAGLSHRNLIRLHELVFLDEHWFFTMELIEGRDFFAHVGDHHDPDFAVLRAALPQLGLGVHALHQAGKLHRDIKPSNVMVDSHDRVVLLDFGLVANLERAGEDEFPLVGTVAYMSPEQADGEPPTTASDWYSVGVMLYLALTGRLPFHGAPMDILADKRRHVPAPPREVALEVPADLDALCTRLLDRVPERRPRGDEVLAALGTKPSAPRRARVTTSPFVGRPRHMAALTQAASDARAGTPLVVHLSGPSGVGKSSLLARFLDTATAHAPDTIALLGRCYERESVPYKGLDAIAEELSRRLRTAAAGDIAGAIPDDVAHLARLFPAFRWLANLVRTRGLPPEQAAAHEQRRRAFTAMRELLWGLARRRPMIVAVDDLQWGDLDTVQLLADVMRPPHPPPILLLLAYRGDDADTSDALRLIASSTSPLSLSNANDRPPGSAEVRALELDSLAPRAATELAMALLDAQGERALRQAEAITRESGGNPYFIGELTRFVNERGDDRLAQEGDRPPTAPPSLEELIWGRAHALREDARALLATLCVAAHPVARAVAVRTLGGPASHEALDELLSSQLIRTRAMLGRDAVEPYHDRIRETIASGLDLATVRATHRRLAEAIAADDDPDPELLAMHHARADDTELAAHYSALAADRAAEAFAFDRAARLYQSALELVRGDHPGRTELQRRCADALANAGRASAAAQVYMTAAESAPQPERRQLRRRAADQLMRSGHISEGLEEYRDLLAALGVRVARSALRALGTLLVRRAWLRLRGLGFRVRSEAEVPADQLERIDTLYSAALGLSFVDPIRGMHLHSYHLHEALRAGEPYRALRAIGAEVAAVSILGTRSRARTEQLIRRASELAAHVELPPSLPHAPRAADVLSATRGIAEFQSARWSAARPLLEQTLQHLRDECNGVAWEIATAEFHLVWLLFWRGDFDEYEQRVAVALRKAEELDDLYAATQLRLAGVYRWLRADQPVRARRDGQQALRDWGHPPFQVPHFNSLYVATHCDLYEQTPVRAWRRVARAWRLFSRSLFSRAQQVRVQMRNLSGGCALAAARDMPHAARRLTSLALREASRLAREQTAFSQPCAQLLRAAAADLAGNRERAVAQATLAEKGFRAAEMALYAAAARWRRGQVEGGDAGLARVRRARRELSAYGVANPAAWVDMLAPGFAPAQRETVEITASAARAADRT